jgi:hypothetical protein
MKTTYCPNDGDDNYADDKEVFSLERYDLKDECICVIMM